MKRALVVTYHFPPGQSVGGLRWAGIGRSLPRWGWNVDVVTVGPRGSAKDAPTQGMTVHRIPRRETLNDLYRRRVVSRRNAEADLDPEPSERDESGGQRRGLFGRLRLELSAWLVFPDIARGWVTPATFFTRQLCRIAPPDVVISSGPPHSAHIVAAIATLGTSVPHVVDMRDPWTRPLPDDDRKYLLSRSPAVRGTKALIERAVFREAAAVVTNTREFQSFLRQNLRPSLEICWIPNGIDRDRLPKAGADPFPGLSLVYAGTLYFGRDLGPVLEAMARFFAEYPTAREAGSSLRVAGTMSGSDEARLRDHVARIGLQGSVELCGLVSPAAAVELLDRSSVAVVLAQSQGFQVPAKIYESVGMGVPTLVVAEDGSASAEEARRIGAMTKAADDVSGIAEVLAKVWKGQIPRRRSPGDKVDYRTIARSTADTLDRIVDRSARSKR